jgi:hypothetical protein
MSQRDLEAAVGISVGGAYYVPSALIEAGLVKLGNFSATPDKWRRVYIWTPKGVAEKAAVSRAQRGGIRGAAGEDGGAAPRGAETRAEGGDTPTGGSDWC